MTTLAGSARTAAVVLAGAIGIGLIAVVLRSSPLLQGIGVPTAPSHGIEQLSGYVRHIDADGTMWVARSAYDLRAPRLKIRPDTTIRVNSKEGVVDDMRTGVSVTVLYESRPEGFVARWIGVNETPNAIDAARAALKRTISPIDLPPAEEPDEAKLVRTPEPPPPAPTLAPPSARSESSVAARNATSPRLRGQVPEGQPRRPPASTSSPTVAPRATEESEGHDPGAVIDWLLRKPGAH